MTPALDRLLAIMARLRDPGHGCPWDCEQNFATIAPYTIEEAYEVADAIARGDMAALKDELGDLLFQVVFHARMAEEAGLFDFSDVAAAIADKMERRHPHVFGDAEITSAAAQTAAWEEHKAKERAERAAADGARASVLDGVALALPALLRAAKIQRRAARIGFDWPSARPVIAKLAEEIAELEAELEMRPGGIDHARVEEEMGDILFAAANLARKLDLDPEASLRRATEKFERRFRRVEVLATERSIGADLAGLEALWQEVKSAEKPAAASAHPTPLPVSAEREGPARQEGERRRIIELELVDDMLPAGLDALRDEARAEGYRMLDRLAAEWHAGTTRFNQPGEALFAAYANGRLAGIGGLTLEPAISGALRMRRFYVRSPSRRHGIARRLARTLLDRREVANRLVTVNAAPGSEPFWEALGFVADRRGGHTHLLLLPAGADAASTQLQSGGEVYCPPLA
jgi:nucleoside triphosphate diphosphatase